MNICLAQRPLVNLPFLLPSCTLSIGQVFRRHESSARRTTKRLRAKPDPSFTSGYKPSRETHDHIVFNPPSSEPSPYHTPAKFLPSNDPRRNLLSQSYNHENPYQNPTRRLPPPVRKPYEKTYHLNDDQIAELRRLRIEDPFQWTRGKLAEKFNCSPLFVTLVCQASPQRKEHAKQVIENIKARWGPRRRNAREDRAKRREMWGRDE
ncbi:hypothetical protein MMC24_001851 [Lignoscripta atroalba]|nr:hypothetical protein [Lignoscripta atroalba]